MRRNTPLPVFLMFGLLGVVTIVRAQQPEQAQPAPEQQAATEAAPKQLWPADQLDNLVAPIALYPDPLLGQVLVASTYPLEVVAANQWLQRNRNLKGQALLDAAKKQTWDPSIQALVAVPDALAKLSEDIRWTADLGNAFLAQQADVMSAVQRMRARAQANGHLSSTPQQTVNTEEQGGQQAIVIQPASPQVIYVPAYDPLYVWGPPVYGYYPSLYYPAWGFGFGIGFNIGFCFDGWGGWGFWGWGPNWYGHSVYVNSYFFNHYGYHHYGYHDGYHDGHNGGYHDGHRQGYGGAYPERTAWRHDPAHRMRVPYGNPDVTARFGGGSGPARDSFRAGGGAGGTSVRYASPSNGRSSGRITEQAYQGASPQTQRYQNPPRPQYQSSSQYQSSPSRYQTSPQPERYQNPRQYQSPQGYQSASRPYSAMPQTERYQNPPQPQSQSSQQRQFSSPSYPAAPLARRFQGQSQQTYVVPQQYRSAPQAYRTPQVQRLQGQVRQAFQAPQQFHSAPQRTAPQFNGGSNRGGGSGGGGGGYRHR